MSHVFVPGWGAPAALYSRALPDRWDVLRPPSFARGAGRFDSYSRWLSLELRSYEEPVTLGGHSMGAALAVLAALEQPERIHRLVLVAPAGLPLAKPIRVSVRDFAGQVASRAYPSRLALRSMLDALRAPRAALRLAEAVRALDLRPQMEQLRGLGLRCSVLGCVTDTLTPPEHCRRIAALSGARYRELEVDGGHMWMLTHPLAFAGALG
jgi:pimeloyl-ACP methyl ester carboxylesterase